jgi:hypothetical protein
MPKVKGKGVGSNSGKKITKTLFQQAGWTWWRTTSYAGGGYSGITIQGQSPGKTKTLKNKLKQKGLDV